MRRLVGFHGDQPACTGISRLNHRLSRRAFARLAKRRGRHGGNQWNRIVRAKSGFSEFHRASSLNKVQSVYFRASVIFSLPTAERSAFVDKDWWRDWWKFFLNRYIEGHADIGKCMYKIFCYFRPLSLAYVSNLSPLLGRSYEAIIQLRYEIITRVWIM